MWAVLPPKAFIKAPFDNSPRHFNGVWGISGEANWRGTKTALPRSPDERTCAVQDVLSQILSEIWLIPISLATVVLHPVQDAVPNCIEFFY